MHTRPDWRRHLARLRGSSIEFDLRAYAHPLTEINALEAAVSKLSDEAIATRARTLREDVGAGTSLSSVRAEVFALVREAARRALGLRPYDVQVVAALALDGGKVVEMQTGEGKTLAAVMPAALNALTGRGVHVLTFNDYLARRDAEWMGPVYRMLGLAVASVQQGMTPEDRQPAYRADVTYVTAKEAGFDHLRDLLALEASSIVHRPFHMALVDEADSLLIDEARVPLVIAGRVGPRTSSVTRLAELVASFTPGIEFDTDEYKRDVELTEAGVDRAERILGCGSLFDARNCGDSSTGSFGAGRRDGRNGQALFLPQRDGRVDPRRAMRRLMAYSRRYRLADAWARMLSRNGRATVVAVCGPTM